MNEPTLLERAKQGDDEAIAAVLNYFLKDRNITAKVAVKGDSLLVLLKSVEVPEQAPSVKLVRKLMQQLNVESIKSVEVHGKVIGQASSAWCECLDLTKIFSETVDKVKGVNKLKDFIVSISSNNQNTSDEIYFRWYDYIPHPTAWFKAFIICSLLAFIVSSLKITGRVTYALAVLMDSPEILILFGIIAVLSPILIIAVFHHSLHLFISRFWGLFQAPEIGKPKILPIGLLSWWEGLYGWLAIAVSTLVTLGGMALTISFYDINYHKIEDLSDLGVNFKIEVYFGIIWFINIAYIYHIEYLVRRRLIFAYSNRNKINMTGSKKFQTDLDYNPDLELDRLRSQMGVNQMRKSTKITTRIRKSTVFDRLKSQKLTKKITLIILIPIVAVAISLFSKWSEISKNPPTTVAPQTSSVKPTPIISTSPVTPIQSDSFSEAVNKAIRAAELTQSAKSKAEWNQVASEWESAIAFMQTVPESSPNYAIAQKKAIEYQANLDYAKRAGNLAN